MGTENGCQCAWPRVCVLAAKCRKVDSACCVSEPRWNQDFTFRNVPYEGSASTGGVTASGSGSGGIAKRSMSAQRGLQIIVCEVDALGQLDYILGIANLSLRSLVRARRLVGDIPLSMLEPDRLAPVLYHNDKPSRPASAHSSVRPASAGLVPKAAQSSADGDPPCSPEIYEDDEDSGGEDGREDAVVAGGRGGAAEGHIPILRGGSGRMTVESKEPAVGRVKDGECAGMVSVDVRVEGCYSRGEKDLLQALRAIGMETCFASLSGGGVKTVDDLVVTNSLDEARLAWLCPQLSPAKRSLIVMRAEIGRRGGFLSRNARRLARAVREHHGLDERQEATQAQVCSDLQTRKTTLSLLESGRSDNRPLVPALGRGREGEARDDGQGKKATSEEEADDDGGGGGRRTSIGAHGGAVQMYDDAEDVVMDDESGVEELMAAG